MLPRSECKHVRHRQFLFLIGQFLKKSFPLKPLGQMNRNLVGSILGLSTSFGSFGKAISEKIFKNRSIRNKNCLWRPCLLMDRDKMSNLYRGQIPKFVKFHILQYALQDMDKTTGTWGDDPEPCPLNLHQCHVFSSLRNKNCLWRPCLLMDRDKMSNLYRGPSIDDSYQVSFQLAKGFQRRRLKCHVINN
jgi:hypothetical protein